MDRHQLTVQEIYNASMKVRNAIPHPRIMGVIRECGGKMWMMESTSNGKATLTGRIMGQSFYGPIRVFPPIRRVWLDPTYPGAQISGTRVHAHGK